MDIVKHFYLTDLPIIINLRGKTKAATLENIETARKKINLKRYISLPSDISPIVWTLLSAHYPFNDAELSEYFGLLNCKCVLENKYLKYMNVSKDTIYAIKCYNELNT